ncbi:hypothetical protein DH2020_004436 [Rehmannia glutinosa]|uniref:Small-subunit processome Utp12 domain-containing protein n=1 Tax=Rehmannia glutinosa TaxID=99300 RepID=A0ABR0XPF1_REHGL
MGSSHIRDILTSFSPALDLFAISLGDGRIKIWDTAKGQVQTEFADIASTETSIFGKQEEGHLSMDYTCMKWLSLEKKKKRKLGSSLLVLGTGGGDVLALDVSAGQLKWRVNNCHPGGVTAVSLPIQGSHIYTAGADGMVCEIDSMSGNLINKFSAASKAISSLAVSPDGNMIATAAAQLKIFNCSNHKKLQKFSGHPGPVRCMIFTEDGRYVLSSALGERYIAVWKIDGSKAKSASAFLAMDHPAVFLDSRCLNSENPDNAGLSVLAISETVFAISGMERLLMSCAIPNPRRSLYLVMTGFYRKTRGQFLISNTEAALLPVPKMFDLNDGKSGIKLVGSKDRGELDSVTLCMEDRLRSLGILGNSDDALGTTLDSKRFKGINLDASTPHKKVKATVSSMEPSDAFTLLKGLVDVWHSRSHSGKHVLPWICCILVYHSDYVKSQEPKLLDFLYKVSNSKGPAINSLFQLSGRLQLVSAQINKATNNKQLVLEHDEQKDESEDEDVDEVVYGIDEDSQSSSDSDD